jgi:N6-L-threonylcarbamoyladenine synthase
VISIGTVIEETMQKAHMSFDDLDAIAVTRGPGLAGSLVVGMNAAKGLALTTGLPIIGINHLEGHLYSAWLYGHDEPQPLIMPEFPAIALLVSGGHSEIILIRSHLHYERLGGTLDDAAGEAFDKVARLIGLEYPGGPSIQKSATEGDEARFNFPKARLDGTWDFSFSGVKTAVLRKVRELEAEAPDQPLPVSDLAASFQSAVTGVLFDKTMEAARQFSARCILIAGGVSANSSLRGRFEGQSDFPLFIPRLSYCTDNAAMIAAAGYQRFISEQRDSLDMDVYPTWPLSRVSL